MNGSRSAINRVLRRRVVLVATGRLVIVDFVNGISGIQWLRAISRLTGGRRLLGWRRAVRADARRAKVET